MIGEICQAANNLNMKKQSTTTMNQNIQVFEQITSAFSNLMTIQASCDNGKTFYLQL